jgi:hypothetical protein
MSIWAVAIFGSEIRSTGGALAIRALLEAASIRFFL